MKKIISLLLVLVMVFSMTVFASAAGNSFTDIYNSKNEDAIEFLYDLGLVEGYSVTKFGPKKNLTRAEACALIVRALIEDDEIYASAKDNFVDVDDYAWYREWVDTAYRNHIMHGYGNGVFGPEDHVTYAQYATILVNALGYDSLDFEGTWPANVEELAAKLDLYDNVSVHVSNDEITREDAAQMLYNALWCKMVGQHGVTLYDVVTAEKYNTYFTTIQILDVNEYGWVKFMEETGNIRVVHKTSVKTGAHEIVVGHYEKVWITCNVDYSKVYGVKYFECAEPVVVAPVYVEGIVEKIVRDENDKIISVTLDGKGEHFFAAEYDHEKIGDIGFDIGVECRLTIVDAKVTYFKFWTPSVEEFDGLFEVGKPAAKYVVNTNTNCIHKAICTHISSAEPSNLKYVSNPYHILRAMGYIPCMDCKPE